MNGDDKMTQMLPATAADCSVALDAAIYAPVLCLVDYGLADADDSRVNGYRGAQLGAIDVFQYDGVGMHRGDRRACHIQADRMDDYLVTIPLHARIDFQQTEQAACVEPGGFALLSTSRPFTASVSSLGRRDPFSALHLRISGALLRQRMPYVEDCCGIPMQVRAGAGVIMQRMCELAISESRGLSSAEAGPFGSMLVDAVVNAAQQAPEILASPAGAARSAHGRIWLQARAYIENHLSDPALGTEAVAEHCRVSKRYLQSVFAENGDTVGTMVRELRLQRCRAALRSPALRKQSIAQIAMHWGFNDMPNFCRAYRARFDRSPSGDRD